MQNHLNWSIWNSVQSQFFFFLSLSLFFSSLSLPISPCFISTLSSCFFFIRFLIKGNTRTLKYTKRNPIETNRSMQSGRCNGILNVSRQLMCRLLLFIVIIGVFSLLSERYRWSDVIVCGAVLCRFIFLPVDQIWILLMHKIWINFRVIYRFVYIFRLSIYGNYWLHKCACGHARKKKLQFWNFFEGD